MTSFFSVERVFFTVLGYPMSYLEFFGTILYLLSVWLMARRSIHTWPVGIVSVVLYLALFYQIRLYADALEQVYYLLASAYGWWYWAKTGSAKVEAAGFSFSPARTAIGWLALTGAGTALLTWVLIHAHQWAPVLFPEPASYPFLDAVTTVMSFVAMWLMALKRIESWIYWIVVDVIGIGLYYAKDVRFVSLLYVVLLVLAISGFRRWMAIRHVRATD